MSLIPDSDSYDVEAVKKVALSLGIPFLVLWLILTPLILLWIVKGCGRAGKYDRYFIRKTPIAIAVGLLWVLIEFFQIIWFSFIATENWPGFNFTVFLNAFQLNFPISWFAWFWIFAGYSLLILTLILLFSCCCGDMSEQLFIFVGVLFMTMIPVFQPLMIKMMEALVCTYPVGEPATLDAVALTAPMVCWEGIHVLYATIAIIVIVVFYPAISITMSVVIGGVDDRAVWLAFLLLQFKMVQVFFYAFFRTFVLAYLLCLLGVNICFLVVSLWLPHKYPILGFLRKISMAMALWCVIPALVAFAINDRGDWTGVGLLIGGWILIPIIAFVAEAVMRRKRAKEAAMAPAVGMALTGPPVDPSAGQGYPPPQGHPPQGYPPQGYPPQGYSPQGYPPQGYPPQGYPPQGYPPQGYPPQGPYPGNVPVVYGVPQQPQMAYPVEDD